MWHWCVEWVSMMGKWKSLRGRYEKTHPAKGRPDGVPGCYTRFLAICSPKANIVDLWSKTLFQGIRLG